MRIDFHSGPQQTGETEPNRTRTGTSADASSRIQTAANQDQAQLSGAHVHVQALAAQASQLPEMREEKVQALRQAVQAGQYLREPHQIAASLMAHMEMAATAARS